MNRQPIGVGVAGVVVCGLAWATAPEGTSIGKQVSDRHIAAMSEPQAMARWQTAMTPELAHTFLAERFVGTWTTTTRISMGEGLGPGSAGETTGKAIIGGRYVEQRASGTMMGMPVESLMIFGYDQGRKLFHATLYDSMGTGVRTLWGNLDKTGTVLTFVGEMDEPMSGEVGKSFMVTYTFNEDGSHDCEVKEILYGDPFTVVQARSVRKE